MILALFIIAYTVWLFRIWLQTGREAQREAAQAARNTQRKET